VLSEAKKIKKYPTNMAARSDKLDALKKCSVPSACCRLPYSDKAKATANSRLSQGS